MFVKVIFFLISFSDSVAALYKRTIISLKEEERDEGIKFFRFEANLLLNSKRNGEELLIIELLSMIGLLVILRVKISEKYGITFWCETPRSQCGNIFQRIH